MLELFPQGFEEIEHSDGLELVAYTDDAGEERLWAAFGEVRADDVAADWEERWRDFHRPVRVGKLWIGPPWETPPEGVEAIVVDPGRAFGTGGHATTRLCLELLDGLERGSLLDVGCGSGVLAIAAARLGFAPVLAVDHDPAAIEATRRNAEANGVELELRLVDVLSEPLPAAGRRGREHLGRERRARHPASRRRARSSPPATSSATRPRRPASAASGASRKEAGRRICFGARSRVPRRGDLLGPLSRLQGLARRRAGDPRAPARGRPFGARRRRRRRGRQHLLRHARGGAQVAPRRRAGRSHASARLRHRLRREPRRRRLRRLARERRGRRAPQRGDAGGGRARRRRDRLRPGRRAARPRPRVREGAGRLQLLVQLLRDPAGARRLAQPPRRGGARARSGAASSRATARSC